MLGQNSYDLAVAWGDGAGEFVDFEPIGSWYGDASPLAIADVDSDGHLDVLLTGELTSGRVLLLFFGGPDRSFDFRTVSAPAIPSWPVFVGDVDGDGRSDVLFSGHVAFATGARQFGVSDMKIANMDLGQVRHVSDMDGDELRDVLGVLTAEGETVGDLYLSSGAADGLERTPVAFPDDFGAGAMGFGDFNDDGIVDVADLHNEPSAGANEEVVAELILRTGLAGTEPAYELLATLELAPLLQSRGHDLIGPKSADIDGDADQDLLFAARIDDGLAGNCMPPESWRTVRFAMGNGDGTFVESPCHPILSTNAGISDFDVADFNGDGLADVVAATVTGVELLLSSP